MKRRAAIRDMIIFAGGVTLLPSCIKQAEPASISLKKISITTAQENLLGAIAETIIPQTDTLGAKEVGAHLFALRMVDDCYETDIQQKFITGLDLLEKETEKRFGNSFVKCTIRQREQILLEVENKGAFPSEIFEFYDIMKKKTIQGYLTSQYVLTNVNKYEMIPSVRYDGYYPVRKLRENGRN